MFTKASRWIGLSFAAALMALPTAAWANDEDNDRPAPPPPCAGAGGADG